MKVLREIGGILALAGGGLVLASVFDNFLVFLQNGYPYAFINIIFAIVAIIGGLMGMAYKRLGEFSP